MLRIADPRSRHFFLLVALAVIAGCESGPAIPPLEPAGGKVLLNQEPLATAQVVFRPSGDTKGNGGQAMTNQAGEFKVRYAHGDADGLPVGTYRVYISKWVMPDGAAPPPDIDLMESGAKETVPQKYSDPGMTELTAKVETGGSSFTFELQSE